MQDAGVVMPREGVAMDYAGIGSRFVALLIDAIILWVVGGIIGAIFGENPMEAGATTSLVNLVISAAYYIYLISQWGTTLGGRVMGLKVVDAQGQPLSVGAAAIRWIGSAVSAIIIFIGYLMAFWDKRKQTLHDKMAGSFVVKA